MIHLGRPLTIIVFFALLCYIRYVSTDCSEFIFRRLGRNYTIDPLTNASFFHEIESDRRNTCGRLCSLEQFCNVWSFISGKCRLYHSMEDSVKVTNERKRDTEIYYEINQGTVWTKIFFVEAGSGINVTRSFLGRGNRSNGSTSIKDNYFRSFWIDVWRNLNIYRVKLSLIKNGVEVRYIIFAATHTTNQDWFSMENVLGSYWTDMRRGSPYAKFQFSFGENIGFIAELKSGACHEVEGWISVMAKSTGCSFDNGHVYPYIRYSNKKYAVNWSDGYGVADALALYIHIR